MRLFLLLALLYFAQGLPSGLIAKALPALLRDQGVSLSLIGFTSALRAAVGAQVSLGAADRSLRHAHGNGCSASTA